ncbi:T9SS type A sorting domain-containing protein [candidate division KSB1 bacterium]|nr:T9SS type A sorting domain-containing protein [candidate division KSB1 bacterium]
MIKHCLFFLFAIAISSAYAIDIQWQGPKPISNGKNPDMEIDPVTGELHVVSIDYTGILYTKLDQDCEVIEGPVHIPNTNVDNGGFGFSPAIAVDKNGVVHLVYRSSPQNRYYNLHYIYKAGAAWSDPLLISSNVVHGYAIDIAVDNSNVIHLVQGHSDDVGTLLGYFDYYQIYNNSIRKAQLNAGTYRADNRLAVDAVAGGDVHVVTTSRDIDDISIDYYISAGGLGNLAHVADIHSSSAHSRNGAADVYADALGGAHFIYGTRFDSDLGDVGSIRYAQYKNGGIVHNKPVTPQLGTGSLLPWKDPPHYTGWGLGGVTATPDGEIVVVAYIRKDNGPLYSVYSADSGETWSSPHYHAPAWSPTDGRALHVIRSFQNNIYLVYQTGTPTIRVQYLRRIGEEVPEADAGGPYVSTESIPVTFDGSASADSGQNAGIALYEWDWDLDGVYDFSSSSPTAIRSYMDDYSGQVRLRVTDLSSNTDIDLANVTVENVPPVVDIGLDHVVNEGASVDFSASVDDPGDDTHTYAWTFSEGGQATGPIASRSYPENGEFSVIVQCEDDDGGTDSDTLNVTVENSPPTAEAGGPYLGTRNLPVDIEGSGTDPGVQDTLTFSWDLDGDGTFETPGVDATVTYAVADTNTVWFRVEDDEGDSDIDSAFVIIRDDAPEIQSIPVQIAFEGDTIFAPLNLDNYISHPSQNPQDMILSVEGGEMLIDTLTNHTLNVLIPDGDWAGQEIFKLYVTDLGGIMDSGQVVYRVDSVNDPPFWTSNVPNYEFNEDGSLNISFISLRAKSDDSDNEKQDFDFYIEGNSEINVDIDTAGGLFHLSAPENWHGSETVTFVVQDPGGLQDTDESIITVNSVNDPPHDFELISPFYMRFEQWPDSVECAWHTTTDPDIEDVLTYKWVFYQAQGSGVFDPITIPVTDTTRIFYPDSTWDTGVYGWKIVASDGTITKDCDDPGFFRKDVDPLAGVEDGMSAIPTDFGLMQNYPNPFNPETQITYQVPKTSRVHLAVYNVLGQQVLLLENGIKEPGTYHVLWLGKNEAGQQMPSGIYLCRMQTEGGNFYRKMMLIQ